ncbi:MAG: DKNYY domain-containing protein [Chitinophagaceae bacterium]
MKYLLISVVIVLGCGNDKGTEKESVTTLNDTLTSVQNSVPDSMIYKLIRDNLYVGKEGGIAFRVTDKSNPEAYEPRYVTTVYVDGVTGAEKRLLKDHVDTASFHVIKGVYYADKSRVYVHNDMSDGGNLATIANVDPKGISVLSCCYAKTKKIVLYQGNIIENADPLTFKIVKSDFEKGQAGLFGKDKHNTYYMGTPITAEEIKQYGVK